VVTADRLSTAAAAAAAAAMCFFKAICPCLLCWIGELPGACFAAFFFTFVGILLTLASVFFPGVGPAVLVFGICAVGGVCAEPLKMCCYAWPKKNALDNVWSMFNMLPV
jgi:hypothetical protein